MLFFTLIQKRSVRFTQNRLGNCLPFPDIAFYAAWLSRCLSYLAVYFCGLDSGPSNRHGLEFPCRGLGKERH